VDERLRAAESVPDVRVLSHDAQRDLLPATSDEYRQLASWRRIELCEAVLDEGHGCVERSESSNGRSEFVSVLVIVLLEPTTPDAEDQPTARDDVNGAGHVCKQLWISVAVAGDEGSDLDAFGCFRPRSEHRPALEVLANVRVGFSSIQGKEVIPVVEHINADLLRLGGGSPDLGIVGVLRVKLNCYSDVWHSGTPLWDRLTLPPTSQPYARGYSSAMAEIEYRPITDEEYPAFARAIVEGFSDDMPSDGDFSALIKSTLPPERTLAAFEGDEIVGTFGGYALDLSIPGGDVPMEGTTVVTVFPTHRRIGLMTEMMRLHLESAVANGYSVAGLWASESGIYGRYGYGIATYAATVTMRGREIEFREDIEIDRVRRISIEQAPEVLPRIFDRALAETSGMFARTADWWKAEVLTDADWKRRGKTSMRIVVHDGPDGSDGYAIYRQKGSESDDGHSNGTVHVVEIVTVTELAHASLWSYLTNVDGCPNVRAWNISVDDPLAMKAIEPRRVKVESHFDALWILILDVKAALEKRSYEQDGTIRFTIANAFRPDVEGSYELAVEDGVASCRRIEGITDLTIDLDVLGALYLGSQDARAYASAARIRADAHAVAEVDRLFRTAKAPWCNQVF
jgi:predicted acetyltransferase